MIQKQLTFRRALLVLVVLFSIVFFYFFTDPTLRKLGDLLVVDREFNVNGFFFTL